MEPSYPFGFAPVPGKKALHLAAAGGIGDAVAGGGAVVLSIIGLAGGAPRLMMSIACVALGVALLLESGAVAARYSELLESLTKQRAETAKVGGGIAVEALAGATGIVFGILALLGFAPEALVSIANIGFGAALLFAAAARSHMNRMPRLFKGGADTSRRATGDVVFGSAGRHVLVGIGAVVLGILGLRFSPVYLNLVALLDVGGSIMLSGAILGATSFGSPRHA